MLYKSFHISLVALHVISSFTATTAVKHRHFLRHEAFHARAKRQIDEQGSTASATSTSVNGVAPMSSTSASIFTYITPSPSASPIAITELSQVITSYAPQMTLCVEEPLVYTSSPYINTVMAGAPFQNSSISPSPDGEEASDQTKCYTMYSETRTTVCATTLTGIATLATVTACSQDITFSSRLGYRIVTAIPSYPSYPPVTAAPGTLTSAPAPALPSIDTVTTYYMAPWQALTAAGYPSEVDVKICHALNGTAQECVRRVEAWRVVPVTVTTSSTTAIALTTEVPGPAQLFVETLKIDLTRSLTTVSLSTVMVVDYEIETESVSTSVVTRTRTRTVYRASTAMGTGAPTAAGASAV